MMTNGKMMDRLAYRWRWLVLLIAVSIAGCDSGQQKNGGPVSGSDDMIVAVTNYPLKYFAEQISGTEIDVVFPVPGDIDPAFWKPDASAVADMQKANKVFLNGAGYESWLNVVTLSRSRLVDTSDGSKDRLIELTDEVVHQHGPEGEHSHSATAFTTWLDIELAISQAEVVRDGLIRLAPAQKETFEANFVALEKKLRVIRKQLGELVPVVANEHLIASHPVYQYLQRAMNLNMHSVHFEPDADPTAEQWAAFDDLVAEHPTKLMLWEDEPLESTQEKLRQRGIKVVVFAPMGNKPKAGDFVSGMQKNVDRLRAALQ